MYRIAKILGPALTGIFAIVPLAFAQPDRSVIIENQTSIAVTGVYASNTSRTDWGDNRLRTALDPGYQIRLYLGDASGDCTMDVRITLVQRREMEGRWNVCENERIVVDPSSASTVPVDFVNRTSTAIRYLYINDGNGWSADLLGPGIMLFPDSRQHRRVRANGCIVTVRGVYFDESSLTVSNVDLCSTETVELFHRKS